MPLEQNGKFPPIAAELRCARGWGLVWGIVLGIPLTPLAMWGLVSFAMPAAAHRVLVAIDPETPGQVVRAEIDGWPLTPRMTGAAGIEFALERTNRSRSHLMVEFHPDGGKPPRRAVAMIEQRRCDIVVVLDSAGAAVSECSNPKAD